MRIIYKGERKFFKKDLAVSGKNNTNHQSQALLIPKN
jgi:hypothetical protein